MATKVKKLSTMSKEVVLPQLDANIVAPAPVPGAPKVPNDGIVKKLGRPFKTLKAVPGLKKTVELKAKARVPKKVNLKINPKNFARVLMENGKGLEGKKILLKNGGKDVVKKRGRKPKPPQVKLEPKESDDLPPVLEPIFPQEENVDLKKKTPKKRVRKLKLPALIQIKGIKQEPVDDQAGPSEGLPTVMEAPIPKVVKKRQRKAKTDTSSIDDVMTDLGFLIDPERIKKEVDDPTLEPGKNAVKPRRMTKKQRLELLKKGFNKKENIENTLSKLDPAAVKVIDRLDLNVRQFKTDLPTIKRRHSIEKFPVSALESNGDSLMPQLSVFNQLPRSISPKTSRKSLKLVKSRSSPYSTRSDSSTRMLRNGKHRKLKDLNLLEGVEGYKRRKRVHSDLSGSETTSKLSGYESDSSFSDLASLHGSEKDSDLSKTGTKDGVDGLLDDSSNLEVKNSIAPPTDVEKPMIDTNSNVCEAVEDEVLSNKFDEADVVKNTPVEEDSQSCKLLHKGLLLDKMKQTFNELGGESSLSKGFELPILSNTTVFDGFQQERKVSVFFTQDMSDAATSTGDLTQNVSSMPEEDELRLLLEQTDPNLKSDRIQIKEIVSTFTTPLADKTESSKEDQTTLDESMSLPQEADQAPVLEKQVNLDPPQNLEEHLEPPVLESIVEPQIARPMVDLKKPVIDDHKIGIAVTEKDNVVLFSIEHLSDDVAEQEDLNQSFEEKVSGGDPETVEDVEESAKVPNDEENETIQENHINESEEVTKESATSPGAPELEIPEELPESSNTAPIEEIQPTSSLSNAEAPAELEPVNDKEEVIKTAEETIQSTEKECDKKVINSEITDTKGKKKAVGDAKKAVQKESPEELAKKESILNALGLQSLKAAKTHVYPKRKGKASAVKNDPYTGTLKTVIKLKKKKGKNSLKMTLQKNKNKHDATTTAGTEGGYKIMKESGSGTSKQNKESSESGGAHRKSHYSNRSNMDGSSEHTSDGEPTPGDKSQPEKSLIVPEKASSFSIHPGRLCKDECSYCFGKFGLFDTPCHIAQMKSVERQNKILAAEKHLTRDSCLCDACYRHVDRKSNSPSYINKSLKRNSLVAPGPRQNHCHVLGCDNVSSNILRRKWIIKMRKSICQVINIDLDNPGLHSIPICDEHFTALEHLMICAMCKRRLARNHIHYLGPEVKELNEALKDDGIPIVLSDKPVVCKLCKCFASIILKDPEERMENSINFFKEYKKRLLHFNDVVPMDTSAADEPLMVPSKNEKAASDKKEPDLARKKKRQRNSSNESSKDEQTTEENDSETRSRSRVPSTDTNNSQSANQDSMPASPEDGEEYGEVDYNTLIPAIAMDCPSDNEGKKESQKNEDLPTKIPRLESLGNAIEISRSYKTSGNSNKSNDLAAQKLGQNPSISLKPNYPSGQADLWSDGKMLSTPSLSVRQLFPGEEELGLMGDVDFKNVLARTPEGWEKCVATIQYDEETKLLWQELQKPYGSKSSFLRHLVLLEKYFRNGDLVLSPTASHHAVNYRESVHNRLRAYDNIPTKAGNIQPPSMVQFNKMHNKTSGGGITNHSNASNGLPPVTISQVSKTENPQSSRAPITLQQLNQPPLYSSPTVLQSLAGKNRPPGLISLNQRAPAPSVVRPQMPSQKIKFPITKHWRPNLIPIEPSKKNEKKPGLVQVISGGKPYHITLEDYKKMCAIKRSFEARQKKIQEHQMHNQNSVLKTVALKKPATLAGKTSGGVMTETRPITLVPIINNASATITSQTESAETILEKLDKQVESLGKGNDPLPISAIALENNTAIQIIPRIPKSLTVIPQTVRKGPPSPILHITKSSSNGSSNGEDSNSQP